jgi:hypothetical protein
MRTYLRGKVALLFMMLGMLLAIPAVALAAELVTSELDTTTPNAVTVTQGGSTSFNIGLRATGAISNLITEANASIATVDTAYSLDGAGNFTKNTPSSGSKFFSSGDNPTGTNSTVTWTGAPTPYSVGATISAAATTPTGDYTLTLSPPAGDTSVSNPSVAGGKLDDGTASTITVHVVAPPPPSDTTPPVITKVVTGTLNNGWYTSDVDVDWTVSDAQSAISSQSGCADFSVTSDQGSTTYTCSATSAGGTSTDTVTIKRDATAPTVTANADRSTPDHNGWYNHALTVSFSGTDAANGSGIASCDPDVNYSGPEGTGKSVSGSCSDEAGNSASATFGPFKYDDTAPTVLAAADRSTPDHNGWYNHALSVSFSGTDTANGSGNVTCDADVNYSGPATNSHTISGSCSDEAGNSAADAFTFKYDATAPTITGTRTPAANGFGWNNGPVTVSYTCGDNLSGVAPADCGPNQTLSSEGAGQSSTGQATDAAGNSANTTVSGINIDLTDPSVSLNGGPANGDSYYFGSVPSAPTCSASDALSGLDGTCSVSGYSTGVGSHTVTATATDRAGRTATATSTYTVLAWTTKGFYQPVDMGTDVLNTVKNGSTVPVKFELFAGPTELTSTSAVSSVTAKTVNCTAFAGDTEDAIEMVTTGGTSLRYDATGGQFIYNWQTPKKPNTCYNLTMTAADGSTLTAYFKLK